MRRIEFIAGHAQNTIFPARIIPPKCTVTLRITEGHRQCEVEVPATYEDGIFRTTIDEDLQRRINECLRDAPKSRIDGSLTTLSHEADGLADCKPH